MGKLPSGLALGNFMWLGSFTECMNVRTTQRGPFSETTYLLKGQYCLATFRKPGPVNPVSKIWWIHLKKTIIKCMGIAIDWIVVQLLINKLMAIVMYYWKKK